MKQFAQLEKFCINQNLIYNDEIDQKFFEFYTFLVEKNKVMNLTALISKQDVEIKHFIDSLSGIKTILSLYKDRVSDQLSYDIIDVGTGAGFPGIPLAIMLDKCHFSLTDSLTKRINFLQDVIKLIKLDNTEAFQGRAEEIGQGQHRDSYDLCVSRAVADMAVLLEYCLPLVKVGGNVLLYKSGDFQEELDRSKRALQVLGGEIADIQQFQIPDTDISRSLITIRKVVNTPKQYPRRPGKPSKSPIL